MQCTNTSAKKSPKVAHCCQWLSIPCLK
jgi:hypothetical protein